MQTLQERPTQTMDTHCFSRTTMTITSIRGEFLHGPKKASTLNEKHVPRRGARAQGADVLETTSAMPIVD